ncbi:HAD hydrolase-like protein [Paenibacillus dendrobii]
MHQKEVFCPHGNEEGCECKKPKPGMQLAAAQEHRLNLSKCVVIGDVGDTDMLAAHLVGAMKALVRTGWGRRFFTFIVGSSTFEKRSMFCYV